MGRVLTAPCPAIWETDLKSLLSWCGIICVLYAGTASAQGTDVDAFLTDHARLAISPAGRYTYAPESQGDTWTLQLVSADCLVSRDACTVKSAAYTGPFPFASYFFSPDDRYLYFVGPGMDGNRASGSGVVQRVALEPLFTSPDAQGEVVPATIKTPQNLFSGLKLTSTAAEPDIAAALEAATPVYTDATKYFVRNASINSYNVFGYYADGDYLYLSRDNTFSLFAHSKTCDAHLISLEGQAISLNHHTPFPTTYVPVFKHTGATSYFSMSGSIFTLRSDCSLNNMTQSLPRVELIDGEGEMQYVGYFSRTTVYPENIPQGLTTAIHEAVRDNDIQFITGVAINVRTNSFLISYQSTTGAEGDEQAPVRYSQYVYRNGKTSNHTCCNGDRPFRFALPPLDGAAGWIQSYTVASVAPTVIFLHGGPGVHEEITENTFVRILMQSGFNVDIVEDAGADYTFETVTRFGKHGYRAFDLNAAAIDHYLAERYPGKTDLYLYAQSFGAHDYVRFAPSLRQRFSRTVLDMPSGTIPMDLQRADPIVFSKFRRLVGDELADGEVDNAYFVGLTACPLQGDVAIFYSDTDPLVSPVADYRTCAGKTNVTFVNNAYGHELSATEPDYVHIAMRHITEVVSYLHGHSPSSD